MRFDLLQDEERGSAPSEAEASATGFDLDGLLEKTSRTFALSIPYLPEPTRREVGLAYLLFRIADTFEDAELWPRRRRVEALEELASFFRPGGSASAAARCPAWLDRPPSEHEGYLELVAETPAVLAEVESLRPGARELVLAHTARTIEGMAGFVRRASDDGRLVLKDLADLQEYCYYVAGIVGEMLTELFLLERPNLEPAAEGLRARARAFGEGLQLVNILKDSAQDADHGRSYLPPGVERAEVFELARQDLVAASRYVALLEEHGAPRGVLAFTALPVQLAWASLTKVELDGPGSKITRPEVFELVARVEAALDAGEPSCPVPEGRGD